MANNLKDRLNRAVENLRGLEQEEQAESRKERAYRLWQEAVDYQQNVSALAAQTHRSRLELLKRVKLGLDPAEVPAMAQELIRLNAEFELYEPLGRLADQEAARLQREYVETPTPEQEAYMHKTARLRELERTLREYDPQVDGPLEPLISEVEKLRKELGPQYVPTEQIERELQERAAEREFQNAAERARTARR